MTERDDDLVALRAPETGRRTDDAFFRAVRADVAQQKRGSLARVLGVSVPALAAGAAAVVVAVNSGGVDRVDIVRAVKDANAGAVDLAAFDDDELAFAADAFDDAVDDAADDFAIPGLAGSSDQELAAIEAALDEALRG